MIPLPASTKVRARRGALALTGLLAALAVARNAQADAKEEEAAPGPSQAQIEAFLSSKPASADVSKAPDAPEAPPPPPRRHGFVVESSAGVMGLMGGLKHVSPTAPWLRTAFGWEPFHWLMVLAQGDIAIASTAYANPPPDPKGYVLWGAGAAVRFGLQPTTALGLYLQGELGAASVTSDVLSTYGFKDANKVGPYFGGVLGVEWYQINPHMALVANGGVRSYASVLNRTIGGETALAWTGSAGLKYTF
jgi:hypothetical protein